MERKKFLLTTAAAIPALLIGQSVQAQKPKRPNKGFVVKATESRFDEKTIIGSSPNDIKVSQKDTNGDLTIFEYTGNDKGGPPLHIHLKQDEIFYIVEGEYLVQVGEEKFHVKSGDTVFAPRLVPHTFAQLTDKGKMFYLFQPSGKMEDFFRKAGKKSIEAPNKGEKASKLFEEHNLKIVGPPLQY